MQRFKKYLERDFIFDNVAQSAPLTAAGLAVSALPQAPGNFEELEFAGDLNGERLVMCVAVVKGKVKRLMFVMSKSDDPDDVRPLSEAEIKALANQKGELLAAFFDDVTR